MNISINLF